ncbi:MAG: hypothetical protein GY706_07610, partial [Bacteroides sp.]|nr:hypothetical protein [Bacteroides sp.]
RHVRRALGTVDRARGYYPKKTVNEDTDSSAKIRMGKYSISAKDDFSRQRK